MNFLAQHLNLAPAQSVRLQIAAEVVEFNLSATVHLDHLLFTLGHLITDMPAIRRVSICTREELTRPIPRLGDQRIGLVEGLEYEYIGGLEAIGFGSAQGDQLLVLGAGSERLARPEFTRMLLDWLVAGRNLYAIHGATVSWGAGTALLSNRGGSGKSTLAAFAVANGAQSCGDDFLLADENLTLYSMSRSVKLAASSPARALFGAANPAVSSLALDPIFTGGAEKDLFRLDDIAGAKLAVSAKPSVVYVPVVSDGWRIKEISERDALQAVAPNSVALSRNRQANFTFVQRLLAELPCYLLESGPEMQEGIDLLRSELAK